MNIIQLVENKFSWLKESYVFYGILLINLIVLSTVKYYPSMDGPAHLYNSNLIYHLIKGDCNSLFDFYTINKILIPNWTSHFILSSLYFILPAWLAEKALLFMYLIGLSISFRLLIKQLCPNNIYLSIFIFPFIYSFLFHLGFYNYSLSFIFLFYALYYWLKTQNIQNFKKYFILFILITLTYFSNVLTFCFVGLCLGLFIISYEISDYYIYKKNLVLSVKSLIKKLVVLFIVSLPGLILLIIFYKNTIFSSSQSQYSVSELSKWINDVRALIVYKYVGEEMITQQFLYIIIVIISISIFLRFYNNPTKKFISIVNKNDILLLPILIALASLYIIPNGSSAGMMSDRYCLMFYMLLIIWVASQPIPKKLSKLVMILIIIFHFGLLFKHQNGTIRSLNNDAKLIESASEFIEPGCIVLPLDMTDNWLESHFSNYLGTNKPIIILENYETSVGWFPVRWNSEKMPKILLNDKTSIDGYQWFSNINSVKTRQIDYVILIGNIKKIDDSDHKELKNALSMNFKLIYFSDNNYVNLYRRIATIK